MAANGISTLSTKQARQVAKLNIAQAKRQGKTVATDGTITGSVDNTKSYYRSLNEYDLTELPTQYSGNTLIDNNNEGGLKQGRPWVSFLPKDLFAASEKGVWYDPSDITSLFQDVAGTVPVTASGQTVALMKDKSGNNLHAVQSTAGNRPTYYVYPNSSYGVLQFNGTNQYMVSNATLDLTGTAKVTASIGLQVASGNYTAGFTKTTYTGYHGDVVTFTDSGTISATTITSSINLATEPTNTTELYIGYLLSDYTGTWTFSLTSDDGSYFWIGDNAVSGYTAGNALINNGGAHSSATVSGTINLVAGQYYPIRVLYGNSPTTGILSLTYAHTGQTATNDYTGKAFHTNPGVALCTGSDTNSVNGTFLIGAPSAIADHSYYLRGTSTVIARVPNEVTGDDVLTGLFDLSQSTKETELVPRLNGVAASNIVWTGTNTGATTNKFGNQLLYIGSQAGSTYFKGNVYGVIVRGAAPTGAQLANTEAWLTSKLY